MLTIEKLKELHFVEMEGEIVLTVGEHELSVDIVNNKFDWWYINGVKIPEDVEPKLEEDINFYIARLKREP